MNSIRAVIFILVSIFLILVSCSKSESPSEPPEIIPQQEVYFTFNVDEEFDTSESDNWLIIHDDNGNLLDFEPYESGSELIFEDLETNVSDKLIISNLSIRPATGNELYHIQTYVDINKKSQWKLQSPSDNSTSNVIGNFKLNINNIPGSQSDVQFSISHAKGQIGWSSTISSNNPGQVDLKIENLELTESNDFMISIIDGNWDIKYYMVEDVKSDDIFNLDYSDFSFFDNTLTISLPSNTTFHRHHVYSYDSQLGISRGYLLNDYRSSAFNSQILNELKLPYLNAFSNYRTEVVVGLDNYVYSRIIYGAKPENINIPENLSLVVNNESIQNFSYSVNFNNIIMKSNTWNSSSGVRNVDHSETTWIVLSPGSEFPVLGDIPQELKNQYPNIRLSELNLKSSLFYTSYIPYQDYITGKFVDLSADADTFHSLETVYFQK